MTTNQSEIGHALTVIIMMFTVNHWATFTHCCLTYVSMRISMSLGELEPWVYLEQQHIAWSVTPTHLCYLIFIICVFLFNELEFYNMSYNSNTIGINCVGITNPRQQHSISVFGFFFYRKSIALLTCYYHIIIINKWLSGKAENIDPYYLFSTISLYFPLKLSWEMLWLCKTPRYLNQTFKSYIKYLYVTDIFRKKKTLILRLSGLMLNNLDWILITGTKRYLLLKFEPVQSYTLQ